MASVKRQKRDQLLISDPLHEKHPSALRHVSRNPQTLVRALTRQPSSGTPTHSTINSRSLLLALVSIQERGHKPRQLYWQTYLAAPASLTVCLLQDLGGAPGSRPGRQKRPSASLGAFLGVLVHLGGWGV